MRNSGLPTLNKINEMVKTIEGWLSVVALYDRFAIHYYEMTKKERSLAGKVSEIIRQNIPEQYKTGAHLLFPQQSFMGEDIYIYDGKVQTTLHASHVECGKYKVLRANKGNYCAHCNKLFDQKDLKFS